MKKLLATIGLTLMLLIPLTTGAALAAPAAEPAKAEEPQQQPGQAKSPSENLLPKFDQTAIPIDQAGIHDELINYGNLTNASWTQIVTSVIKTILFVAGALVMVGLLVVGAMFMTGSSNEENITKARKILIYLVIGIILISVSYAVVSGISQFDLGEL